MKAIQNEQLSSTLIAENKEALCQLEANLIFGKNVLTQVLQEWYILTNQYLTIQELSKFYGTGRNQFLVPKYNLIQESLLTTLVEDKKQLIKNSGIQISTEKLKEIVDLPDTTTLNQALDQLIFAPDICNQEKFFWHAYSIKLTDIIIISEVHEQLKDHFRFYAKTEQQKVKLIQVRKLCSQLNSIFTDNKADFDSPLQMEIRNIVKYEPLSGQLVPDPQFILYGISKKI